MSFSVFFLFHVSSLCKLSFFIICSSVVKLHHCSKSRDVWCPFIYFTLQHSAFALPVSGISIVIVDGDTITFDSHAYIIWFLMERYLYTLKELWFLIWYSVWNRQYFNTNSYLIFNYSESFERIFSVLSCPGNSVQQKVPNIPQTSLLQEYNYEYWEKLMQCYFFGRPCVVLLSRLMLTSIFMCTVWQMWGTCNSVFVTRWRKKSFLLNDLYCVLKLWHPKTFKRNWLRTGIIHVLFQWRKIKKKSSSMYLNFIHSFKNSYHKLT